MSLPPPASKRTASLAVPRKAFAQLYRAHIPEVIDLIRADKAAAQLLFHLVAIMDANNGVCISISGLAFDAGMSRSATYRAIGELKARNFVAFVKSGGAKIIVLNDHVVWTDSQSKRGRHKYTFFSVTAVAYDFEQDEKIEEIERTQRENPLVKVKE